MTVTLEPATTAHAAELAPALCLADLAEVWALGYFDAYDALRQSLEASTLAWAARIGGELAAVFGVVPLATDSLLGANRMGCVWLLTGRAVAASPMAFWRALRAGVRMVLAAAGHDTLTNAIDERHAAALSTWERLGVHWVGVEPVAQPGLQFRRFVLEVSHA